MQLLKTLFCLRGAESSPRFLVIQLLCYLGLSLGDGLSGSFWLYALLSIALLGLVASSAIRFARFQHLAKPFILGPILSFLISALSFAAIDGLGQSWLLLLPIAAFAAMLVLGKPTLSSIELTMGYAGPVDLSEFKPVHHSRERVEPVLGGGQAPELTLESHQHADERVSRRAQAAQQATDWSQVAQQLLAQKRLLIGIGLIALLGLAGLISYSLVDSAAEQQQNQPQIAEPTETLPKLMFRLPMPDDFVLHLDENQGLVVEWQATAESVTKLWDQATARGNRQCSTIEFNRGDTVRSLKVMVENQTGYQAYFSPLDTKELINLLAKRGNFSLCGFKFSLEGSMAALGQAPKFSDFVDY